MKKCLILGGNGFLGRNLCHEMLENKYDVAVYNRKSDSLKEFFVRFPNVEVIEGELEYERNFSSILKHIDVVFYLISTTTPANRDLMWEFQSNIIPVIPLLHACAESRVRFIFFSSGGTVYGIPKFLPITEEHRTNPISPYGIHKLSLEKCVEYYGYFYGLDYIILRITNPYGAYQNPKKKQGAIAVFLAKALMGETIDVWGDGSVVRDYLFVKDLMRACSSVIEYQGNKKIFNLSSGYGHSIEDVLHVIENSLGEKLRVRYLSGRLQDVPISILDNALAKKELGWEIRFGLEEGIESMRKSWDPSHCSYKYEELS